MDGESTATLGSETGASTETKSTESTGQGEVETQGSQGQPDNAGGSQEFSESGKDQGTDTRKPQFRSKNQTIYELRQKIREQGTYWEQEVGTLKQQLAEIQKMFGRGQEQKPSRTFWEAPEEVMDERFKSHFQSLRDEFREMLQKRDTDSQQTSEWKQETSEAAKFIRDQKDLTEDDILEITELVREHPSMEKLRPQERAEYALYLFGKSKGISDKTPLKNKAHVPSGTNAPAGKPRQWTEADIAQEVNKMGDPKRWTPDQKKQWETLENEIRNAYRENRVKK